MYSRPTHDECVTFNEKYGSLSSLLASFIQGQEEEVSQEEGLKRYLNEEVPAGLREAVVEGRAFLAQKDLPWTLILDGSNVYQPDEEQARAWLTQVLETVEKSLQRHKPDTAID